MKRRTQYSIYVRTRTHTFKQKWHHDDDRKLYIYTNTLCVNFLLLLSLLRKNWDTVQCWKHERENWNVSRGTCIAHFSYMNTNSRKGISIKTFLRTKWNRASEEISAVRTQYATIITQQLQQNISEIYFTISHWRRWNVWLHAWFKVLLLESTK